MGTEGAQKKRAKQRKSTTREHHARKGAIVKVKGIQTDKAEKNRECKGIHSTVSLDWRGEDDASKKTTLRGREDVQTLSSKEGIPTEECGVHAVKEETRAQVKLVL